MCRRSAVTGTLFGARLAHSALQDEVVQSLARRIVVVPMAQSCQPFDFR